MAERLQPAEGAELRIDLATARLDSEDVDQFLVGVDQAGLDRERSAELGLGFTNPPALALDPAGQEVGLSGDGLLVGDVIDRGEGRVEAPLRGRELCLEHPVQSGLGAQLLEELQRLPGLVPAPRQKRLLRVGPDTYRVLSSPAGEP
jgi:hypothetical protein